MNSSSITKACVIPVCENEKFTLVHKFPADQERFNEWLSAIQKYSDIEKLAGLTPEAIRKRFFVCARHFGLKQYKNVESRGLNLTAVPHLNLQNLDDIELSKGWQIEQSFSETISETTSVQKSSFNLQRILNSAASTGVLKTNPAKVIKIEKTPRKEVLVTTRDPIEEPDIVVDSPPKQQPKRFKRVSNESANSSMSKDANNGFSGRVMTTNRKSSGVRKRRVEDEPKPQVFTRKLQIASPDAQIIEMQEELAEEPSMEELKPQNKLLALIEVTPEQFEKLNKSLTTAERSENVTSLINFMNSDELGDELDPVQTDNELEIVLEDEKTLRFDLFWLRDHCRCETCYDFSTHQRKLSILDIPDDITANSYLLEGENLIITWNDEHESVYKVEFLLKNQPMGILVTQPLSLWNKEILETPLKTNCRVSMRDYMSDPDVSKKVLENLFVYGVAFIDGVQPTQQNTEFVIRQLFPIHKTLFGEMWTFSDAKKDHSDTAYTNNYLGAHNDNTYFNDAAGLQILHCINESCVGGENFLIDGFQVAQKIKENHPEVFNRLTTTLITGEYIEEGRHHKYSSPIINLNSNGELEQIRFNLYDRAPFKSVPAEKIRQFYIDLKILTREFEDPDNRIIFKLKPGTVMIFDNWRVLHGRLSYTGKRTMTGCYVARTEYQSTLRVNNFIE